MSINVHEALREAWDSKLSKPREGITGPEIDVILALCEDSECSKCAEIICPHGCILHFHHDGCPACAQSEEIASGDVQMIEGWPVTSPTLGHCE